MKLTQALIDRGVPGEAIHFDDDLPAFGLRVRASGSATFIVQYKHGKKQRRMTSRTSRLPNSADPISSPTRPARPIRCSS